MLESLHEDLTPLREIPAFLPRLRGKKIHISTLYRWSSRGCRGVVLETIQVGSTRCTSREALARFFQRLTEGGQPLTHTTPARRRQQDDHDEAELSRLGI